jgi:DNA repair and recombination RAD54-like protein
MPRQSVEIRRRRALILNDGDEDDGGGRAGEAGAGGAPSSSSQPVAAARGPEIIDIDDDEEEEEEGAEVVADAEVQLGEGGGLVVKEEPPTDSDSGDVDWDELERLYPSDEERSGKASYAGGRRSGGPTGSPCGEVKCASSTSGGASTGRQEGASEVAGEAEEMDLEDDDGAEEGQQDHQEEEDKDEEYEVEEEEDDDDEETEEDEAGDEESEAGEGPGRRGVPCSARAAAGDSATEVFLRRKFEGWLISRVADTANDAGSTVAARTRSRRRCPNRKLLRRGTCSKPYCVDTASSESAWESSESEKAPPRAPAPSSSEEREPGAGGRGSYRRTVTGKRRRRGMKPAHGDDSSDSGGGQGVAAKRRGKYMKNNAELGGGGGEDRGTAARRRGKRAMEPDAAADGHGDDDESDGPFASSRKPKGAYAFKNKDGFGDVTFKNSSLVIPRGQGRRERETYDDLLDTIFEGIENYHNGSAPPDASVPPAQGQGCDTLPLIFSFGDEEEVVVEKTEHEEVVEELFADWDNLVLEEQQQYNDDPAHTHDKVTN